MNFLKLFLLTLIIFLYASANAQLPAHEQCSSANVSPTGVHYTIVACSHADKEWLALVHGFTHDQRYYEAQL